MSDSEVVDPRRGRTRDLKREAHVVVGTEEARSASSRHIRTHGQAQTHVAGEEEKPVGVPQRTTSQSSLVLKRSTSDAGRGHQRRMSLSNAIAGAMSRSELEGSALLNASGTAGSPTRFNRRRTIAAYTSKLIRDADALARESDPEATARFEARVEAAVEARFQAERERRIASLSVLTQCDSSGAVRLEVGQSIGTQTSVTGDEVDVSTERLYGLEMQRDELRGQVAELKTSLSETKQNMMRVVAKQMNLQSALQAAATIGSPTMTEPMIGASQAEVELSKLRAKHAKLLGECGALATKLAELRSDWVDIKSSVASSIAECAEEVKNELVAKRVLRLQPTFNAWPLQTRLNGMREELNHLKRFVQETVAHTQAETAQEIARYVANPTQRERDLISRLHAAVRDIANQTSAFGLFEKAEQVPAGDKAGLPMRHSQRTSALSGGATRQHGVAVGGDVVAEKQTDQGKTFSALSWRNDASLLEVVPQAIDSLRVVARAVEGIAANRTLDALHSVHVRTQLARFEELKAASASFVNDVSGFFSAVLGFDAAAPQKDFLARGTLGVEGAEQEVVLCVISRMNAVSAAVRTNVTTLLAKGAAIMTAKTLISRSKESEEALVHRDNAAEAATALVKSLDWAALASLWNEHASEVLGRQQLNGNTKSENNGVITIAAPATASHESRHVVVNVDKEIIDNLARSAAAANARLATSRRSAALTRFRLAACAVIRIVRLFFVCVDASRNARTVHRIEAALRAQSSGGGLVAMTPGQAPHPSATQVPVSPTKAFAVNTLSFVGQRPASSSGSDAPVQSEEQLSEELRSLMRRKVGAPVPVRPPRPPSTRDATTVDRSATPRRVLVELQKVGDPTPTPPNPKHTKGQPRAAPRRQLSAATSEPTRSAPSSLFADVPVSDVLAAFFAQCGV